MRGGRWRRIGGGEAEGRGREGEREGRERGEERGFEREGGFGRGEGRRMKSRQDEGREN